MGIMQYHWAAQQTTSSKMTIHLNTSWNYPSLNITFMKWDLLQGCFVGQHLFYIGLCNKNIWWKCLWKKLLPVLFAEQLMMYKATIHLLSVLHNYRAETVENKQFRDILFLKVFYLFNYILRFFAFTWQQIINE